MKSHQIPSKVKAVVSRKKRMLNDQAAHGKPTKKAPKNIAAIKKNLWGTMLDEAAILETIKAKSSLTNDELMQFLSAGEKSVVQVDRDISKRITFLLWLACLNGELEKEVEKLIPYAKSQGIDVLCSIANSLNFVMLHLAKLDNNPRAAECIWDNAVKMVSAIKELATNQPDLLKPRARKALFLPSLRARAKKFTDDFYIVADAIELSKDFPTKTGDNALYDLDSLVTKFVVKLLDEAEERRTFLLALDGAQDVVPTLKGFSREQVLMGLPGIRQEHLAYLDLPPYRKTTAKAWWDICIKPILDSPETLKQLEGTKLYNLLAKGAKLPVDYAIRDYLKKLCESKVLKSLAP